MRFIVLWGVLVLTICGGAAFLLQPAMDDDVLDHGDAKTASSARHLGAAWLHIDLRQDGGDARLRRDAVAR